MFDHVTNQKCPTMRKWCILGILMLFSCTLRANHWVPNPYQFVENMFVIGVIEINGAEQANTNLELGAFYDSECRGSCMLNYYENVDRHMVFMTLYGETGDTFQFALYDHATETELDLSTEVSIPFTGTTVVGTVGNPFVFSFSGCPCSITVSVMPECGGVISGTGTCYYGQTATLTAFPSEGYGFAKWTEDGALVSEDSSISFTVFGNRHLVAHFMDISGVGENVRQIQVYPNPNEGRFLLTGVAQSEIKVFDAHGRLLYMTQCENEELPLDLSYFAKGVYFVEVRSEEKSTVRKMVMQ